jgi:hypothetical protein
VAFCGAKCARSVPKPVGPITLFDKSFLQSLSLDESIWFAHFFAPVVCPLFYVETLADLEKVRKGRTAEQEVRIIADKFPEQSAYPCMHHAELVTASLLGWPVPMNGQIPRGGGRIVQLDGKTGVIYEKSKEEEAFSRWQRGRFLDVERGMAKHWRRALKANDLPQAANAFRNLGIDGRVCKSLEDARTLARNVVTGTSLAVERMGLILFTLGIDPQDARPILARWMQAGMPPMAQFAPYAAYVVEVELFFQFALAANLVSAERASNRVDVAYLHYLPFCMAFVSCDKLHQRCAPLFLRDDQEFVWGFDLKPDLERINEHFAKMPDAEKEQGIMRFAHAPPNVDGSVVRRLRARFLKPGYDDRPPPEPPLADDPRTKELLAQLKRWKDAPTDERAHMEAAPGSLSDVDSMSIQRLVPKRKGSWWLLPKDLNVDDSE